MSLATLFKSASHSSSSAGITRNMTRKWVHPPEALLRGHVVYVVKFLGGVEVDSPKGIEVVREAVMKMKGALPSEASPRKAGIRKKFNNQLKRSDGKGDSKLTKVEFTVSVDGLTIQDMKSKVVLHRYPLHRISYCADDKAEKKMFIFIAKEDMSSQHKCFVFVSDKSAEEITLTVGQAFDLAYRKFLESSGSDIETKKNYVVLQKKVQQLERENEQLRHRLVEVQLLKDKGEVDNYKIQNNINDMGQVSEAILPHSNGTTAPPPSAPQPSPTPQVGTKLENLMFDDNFNPPASPDHTKPANNGTTVPTLTPPPRASRPPPNPPSQQQQKSPASKDLFGMDSFEKVPSPTTPPPTNPFDTSRGIMVTPTKKLVPQMSIDLDTEFGRIDQQYSEIQEGFSKGLAVGNDDFQLHEFDPLSQ